MGVIDRLDYHNNPLEGSEFVAIYEHAYTHDLNIVTVNDQVKYKFSGVGGWSEKRRLPKVKKSYLAHRRLINNSFGSWNHWR